jgi:hypothetical protein
LLEKKTQEQGISWAIKVRAQCQQARDVDNVAGVGLTASEGWDNLDFPEPPSVGEYVSVYFPHRDWGRLSKRFCTDFRPEFSDGSAWEFEVKTNIRDLVQLTFAGLKSVPDEFEIWLVDEPLNLTQNLRVTPHFFVAGVGEKHPKRLKLLVGKNDFIGETLQDVQQIPTEFELSQNFPNPFNPVTTIQYGLPSPSRITLKVYNLLGKEVMTLVDNELKEAGYHTAIWNGRNAVGDGVVSGVYFIRIRVGNFVQTQKMLLIR